MYIGVKNGIFMKKYALILAGGIGSRMNSSIPKQFMLLDNEPILAHTLRRFDNHEDIDGIVLVMHGDYIEEGRRIAEEFNIRKLIRIVPGGSSRKQSSFNGVAALPEDEDSYVLIHDAARPFVSDRIISECCAKLQEYAAVSTVIESSDTVYLVNSENIIQEVPDRNCCFLVQTPQAFHYNVIAEAHRMGADDPELNFTDDAGMVQYYELADVYCIQGEAANCKITTPDDLKKYC